MNNEATTNAAPVCFPDGSPVPAILTPIEVCKFLRIQKTPTQARRTLDHYRTRGLRAFRIGSEIRYRLDEVLRFVKVLEEEDHRQ